MSEPARPIDLIPTRVATAEDYPGENVGTLSPSCGKGACWHWRNNVDCPADPWPICECGDLALLDSGACPHGTGWCASCADRCDECAIEKADARDDFDRKHEQEREVGGW